MAPPRCHPLLLKPCSPELNRIEKLWHMVKHTWMAAKRRDAETLEANVSEILNNVGSRYNLAFLFKELFVNDLQVSSALSAFIVTGFRSCNYNPNYNP